MPQTTVTMTGPLFDGRMPIAIKRAVSLAVGDLLSMGEKLVKEQLYPGHGLVTGHYRRSVRGEFRGSRHGIIHDQRVVYGPWLEGVSSRNQTTRFKGYRMFRNAQEKLNKEATEVVEKRVQQALRIV